MKKILSFIFLVCAVAASPQDPSEIYGQTHSVMASGGGAMTNDEFQITATVGQTVVVSRSSNAEGIAPGFWPVVNTNLFPVVLYNAISFGITTSQEKEVQFGLVISNEGSYPLDYEIRIDAAWENYEWLSVSQVSGQLAGGDRNNVMLKVVETKYLQEGFYEGRLLVTSNTGPGLSPVTDTVRVDLLILPPTSGIASGDTTISAGDSPPVNITDADGNYLGVSVDFIAGQGGDLTVASIPVSPPSDSTTVFYDPDRTVVDPVYADFYWEISSTIPAGFVVDITFDYTGQVSIRNPRMLRIARRMSHAGPGVMWEFLAMESVVVDEANQNITAISQTVFSQWTVASDKADNTFKDTEAPVISDLMVSPESPKVLEPITVYATVTDESSVESVSLYYVKGGGYGFKEIPMTANGGVYSTVIPANDVTLTGIAYTIRAVDMVGYGRNSDTLSVPVQFEAEALSTGIKGSAFPTGIPDNRWRLISVPAELDEPGIYEVFADELKGKPSETTWKMVEWTGSNWDDVSQVNVGKGYWLYQRVWEDVVFSTGSGRSVDLTGTTITLQPGWNLIGSPYPFVMDVAVDPAQFYGPLTYSPDFIGGEGWSDVVTELLPWGAYILYNRSSSAKTIDIQPLEKTGTLPRMLASKRTKLHQLAMADDQAVLSSPPFRRTGWTLQLRATGETYSDVANTIGRMAGANEQLDYLDNPEPPYMDGYVSLAMVRPEWFSSTDFRKKSRFSSDIRSLEETDGIWDINLYVKDETGPVRLTHEFSGPQVAGKDPFDFQIVFLDLTAREVYDLTNDNEELIITKYTSAKRTGGEAFPYPLKVIAGSADYVSRTVDEILSLLPDKISLSQNYPNPFNPSTRIRYSLPKPQLVNLKVYNVLGQEVITLVDGWIDVGYHEVIWDGKNRFGQNVASGLYFSTLFTDKRVLSRKMIMIR